MMRDRSKVQDARPIGVSGVEQFGGFVYHSHEYDAAWKGLQRDRTIHSMLNDPLVGSILFGIEMLVRRVEWSLQAADESDEAKELGEFVEQCLDDMAGHWPGDTLAQILTFLGWGWSCLEITYKQRLGRARTTRKRDDTAPASSLPASRYDDGRIGWNGWELRPQLTRYGWAFSGSTVTGLVQQDPTTLAHYTIPLSKCLLFRYASRDNSPEGSTPLRVAFDAWYYKRQIQRIEAVGIERDLAGLPVVRVPASEIEGNTAVYLAAIQIATGVRNDTQAGVVMPSDRDEHGNLYQELELLSSGGARSFDTDTVIRRYANEVVTAFLANVMRAGQDNVGSLSLSSTQADLFQRSIGAHLDTIADTIFEQAIVPLMEVNGLNPELAPKLVHGDIESANLEQLGQYIVNLASAGMLANTPELRAFVHEVAGLPVPSKEELEEEMEGEAFEHRVNSGQIDQGSQRNGTPASDVDPDREQE
jgi:hypothetical protein